MQVSPCFGIKDMTNLYSGGSGLPYSSMFSSSLPKSNSRNLDLIFCYFYIFWTRLNPNPVLHYGRPPAGLNPLRKVEDSAGRCPCRGVAQDHREKCLEMEIWKIWIEHVNVSGVWCNAEWKSTHKVHLRCVKTGNGKDDVLRNSTGRLVPMNRLGHLIWKGALAGDCQLTLIVAFFIFKLLDLVAKCFGDVREETISCGKLILASHWKHSL